jgi:hypothetical protein
LVFSKFFDRLDAFRDDDETSDVIRKKLIGGMIKFVVLFILNFFFSLKLSKRFNLFEWQLISCLPFLSVACALVNFVTAKDKMGVISMILEFSGFGIEVSVGVVIGYFLFIYDLT